MPDRVIPITDEAAQRRNTIRDTWDRYDGEHPASLDPSQSDVNDNVTLNNLATIIDTGADFLTGSGSGEIEFGVLDGDDEATEARDWLDELFERNRKRSLLRDTATSGGIAGHFYLKIVPEDDPRGLHRIILLDPLDVIVEHDAADLERVTGYAIDTTIWDESGTRALGRRREQHTIDDGGESWTVEWLVTDVPLELAGQGSKVRWIPDPARPDAEPWAYPFPAIVDGKNLPAPHRAWGRPDLSADILHMQEAINRVASNEQKTLRLFAHPQPYATAGDGSTPDALAGFVDASIGQMMCLPNGSTLGVLPVQHEGLAAAAVYRESLTDKLFEVARTPRIAAGKVDGVGSLSGVALLILYRPLIAKTETKRDTYGDALRELCRRLLVLGGWGDTLRVVVVWPDVLPKDIESDVRIATELRELGISLRSVLERLGIDYDQELERIREEQQDPETDTHGLLARIDELQAQLDAAPADPVMQGGDREA